MQYAIKLSKKFNRPLHGSKDDNLLALSLTMGYFNFNGRHYPDSSPVVGPDSRALRYGDGLFETIKFANNQLLLIDEHLARLWNGLQLLQFEIPKFFTPDRLQTEIISLLQKNNYTKARIRLAVFRGDGGLYDHKNALHYTIQAWPLPPNNGIINENGLQLGIFRDAKKAIDAFSNCKHNNFLPYLMGALHAKKLKLNDALILNQYGRVCDSTIANIFIVTNERISTPPLNEGCIAGIMRKTLIHALAQENITVYEEPLNEENLLNTDEVFLTNSIANIRWVASIGSETYTNFYTTKIIALLSKTLPDVFC